MELLYSFLSRISHQSLDSVFRIVTSQKQQDLPRQVSRRAEEEECFTGHVGSFGEVESKTRYRRATLAPSRPLYLRHLMASKLWPFQASLTSGIAESLTAGGSDCYRYRQPQATNSFTPTAGRPLDAQITPLCPCCYGIRSRTRRKERRRFEGMGVGCTCAVGMLRTVCSHGT